MRCPYCSHMESKVLDSRPTDEGGKIRRRRECLQCMKRFTTYEVIETTPIVVVKKDRSREAFNREKLLVGLIRASAGRAIPTQTLENIVDQVQTTLQNTMEKEIPSAQIGELVMEHLRELDEVTYVRFASVYRKFTDVDSFMAELKALLETKHQDI